MRIGDRDKNGRSAQGNLLTASGTWKSALVSLLIWKGGNAEEEAARKGPALPIFDLQPTSVLALQLRRRRLLNSTQHQTQEDVQEDWFHPNTNAVYATIPKKEDQAGFERDELLEDFHRYRHLSRHERHYRQQNGLNLEPDWDGVYVFHDESEDGIINSLENHVINATSNASISHERSLQATHVGGRFNNYQSVALSQGYGTHYASAWVGSPTPQRKTLIVDTGSHYTAFPCTGCRNCGLQHHTDPYYSPEKSKSFHLLQCSECREGVQCQDDKCVFSQSYTEGSSWEAYQVRDKFYCGGNDFLGAVDPNDQKYVIDFMFGCQLSLNGLFISQLADGIIGMSMYDTTLTKQMYNKGRLEHNIFALCYRRELGSSKRGVSAGSMTLGGVFNTLDTSPIIYAKNMASIGFFTVYVKGIFIRSGGGQSARTPAEGDYSIHKVPLNVHKVNSGKGVIVDSGTTDTYLNKNMARSFNKMWRKVTGRDYAHSPISLNDEQLRSLPTILVQCQAYDMRMDPSLSDPNSVVGYVGHLDPSSPTDLLIAIPATNYMEYSPRTKQYASRVYFTETSGGVLGSNTMQGHNVVFDWENGRIGFAESSCTYDRREVPRDTEEGRYSNDCTLGKPILTAPCIETVDKQLCDNNPSNIALLGTETWTLPVVHPGIKSGLSCVDAVKRQAPITEIDPSEISCNGEGVCTELRSCQLRCDELPKAGGVTAATSKSEIPVEADEEDKCADAYWSACDFKCNQTKVETVLYTDGQCHERSRESRSCHKDACGRSDPCRVPFIVHSIYVLRGISSSRWSNREDNIFAEAVTHTFHSLSLLDRILFRVGDVKVVLTRPWAVDDNIEIVSSMDNEEAEPEELGVKVVLQISIFNSNTELTNDSDSSKDAEEKSSNLSELVKNLTDSIRGSESPPTVCKDADLYALAKDARLIAYAIPELPGFMQHLISDMMSLELEHDTETASAFAPLYSNYDFAQQSRLESAWTIRTDVDDEINYFGPPEPIFFTMLRYVHRIALLVFCFSLFAFMFGVAVQSMDFIVAAYNSGRVWLPGGHDYNSEYEQLSKGPENGEAVKMEERKAVIFEKSSIRRRFSIGRHKSESTIIGETKLPRSIELTELIADTRNAFSPKKRRNSGTDLSHQSSV